jgi:hypothetical protein
MRSLRWRWRWRLMNTFLLVWIVGSEMKIVKKAVMDKMLKEGGLLKPVKSGYGKLLKRRTYWSVISTAAGVCKRYGP